VVAAAIPRAAGQVGMKEGKTFNIHGGGDPSVAIQPVQAESDFMMALFGKRHGRGNEIRPGRVLRPTKIHVKTRWRIRSGCDHLFPFALTINFQIA
jgi:hypothetical protein